MFSLGGGFGGDIQLVSRCESKLDGLILFLLLIRTNLEFCLFQSNGAAAEASALMQCAPGIAMN
jgi:hypothetical protein